MMLSAIRARKKAHSNGFFLLLLLQDNLVKDHGFGKYQSTVKKGELNPVYNETFTFHIPTLNNM